MADITVPTPDLTDSGRSIPGGEGFIEPGQLHDSKYHFEASLLIIRKSDHYGDKTLWSPPPWRSQVSPYQQWEGVVSTHEGPLSSGLT